MKKTIREWFPEYNSTLRDKFAMAVLAGHWVGRESDFIKIDAPIAEDVARSAYKIADAMMKVRNET